MLRNSGVCLLLAALCGCPVEFLAPCAVDADCPEGRCRFGGCGPVCLDDTECPAHKSCSDGACVERAECVVTADCAEDFSCSAGQCLCDSNKACSANQECRQGRCEAASRCTAHRDCPAGQRCEVTGGSCLPACTTAESCDPDVMPQLARLLFACQSGACVRRCVNDVSCGGQGFICEAGLCARTDCATQADCASGQYCTSATAGRCLEYRVCQSTAECPAYTECRAFGSVGCPPGFDCALKICQQLPRCLLDTDCAAPAYCEQGFCQPSTACSASVGCATGQECVAQRCVPGGCRGHADCPAGQACTGGACRAAPAASEITSLAVSPRTAVLAVGGQVRLSLVAFTFSGESFPLATGSFSVVDGSGVPSDAAAVSASGVVTAARPGTVHIRAGVSNPGVAPVEVSLSLLPTLRQGRRVTVVDATTGSPLPGVVVRGCDAPPAQAPCPAPVEVRTDASGAASFASFTGTTASFSAASSELRADGFPRYDRMSVVMTAADDVLLPLGENPVHGSAGYIASIGFSSVHSSGFAWLGYSVLSVGDAAELDMTTLLGEPFHLKPLNIPQPVSMPGTAVLYVRMSASEEEYREVKLPPRSMGLGQPGRRALVAFAGKADWAQVLGSGAAPELLSYTSAMDYALQGFASIPLRPRVPDLSSDLDSDRFCSGGSGDEDCILGPEDIPDYYRLPGFNMAPRREQTRRTEVVLPELPASLDTVVLSAVQSCDELGLVPLGFSSQGARAPLESGARSLRPVLLRSGAPYGGVEAGTPAIWAFATQRFEARGDVSGRILRGPTLPTQVSVPAFLPLPSASYAPAHRTLTPSPTNWSALSAQGVSLARVSLTGPRGRHVVLVPLAKALPALRIPEAP
ncbi:MAG TPA: hypothetical protein VF815_17795, partial [Myxococcaceae bacterium]